MHTTLLNQPTMPSQPLSIPSVDLSRWVNGSPTDRTQLAAELRAICHEIGFFYLVNHGVSEEFLERHMAKPATPEMATPEWLSAGKTFSILR